jgi:protein AATF/BFR2
MSIRKKTKGKISLGEQISSLLAGVAPEAGEDDGGMEMGGGNAVVEDRGMFEDDEEELGTGREIRKRKLVMKGFLPPVEEDPRYAGRKVERSDVFEDFREEEGEGEEDYKEENDMDFEDSDEYDEVEESLGRGQVSEEEEEGKVNLFRRAQEDEKLVKEAGSLWKKGFDSLLGSRVRLQKVMSVVRSCENGDDCFQTRAGQAVQQEMFDLLEEYSSLVMHFSPDKHHANFPHADELDELDERVEKSSRQLFMDIDEEVSFWDEETRLPSKTMQFQSITGPLSSQIHQEVETVLASRQESEWYDDSDFLHRVLLRSVFDSQTTMGSRGKTSNEGSKHQGDLVDRKASKGRKIRYEVIDPLVHFMAPEVPTKTREEERMDEIILEHVFGN